MLYNQRKKPITAFDIICVWKTWKTDKTLTPPPSFTDEGVDDVQFEIFDRCGTIFVSSIFPKIITFNSIQL